MDIIDTLTNMTQNVNNKKTSYDLTKEQIANIKKKIKEIKHYEYKQPNELEIGMMIRYVNRNNPTKSSIIGIIKNIEYYSLINTNNVKTIFLYDIYTNHNTKWKINPKHVYIFHVKRPKKTELKQLLENLIGKEFDELSDQDNINIDFFKEELRKYKESK